MVRLWAAFAASSSVSSASAPSHGKTSTAASKSFAVSQRSNFFRSCAELSIVFIALGLVATIAPLFFFRRGYILYYGDAQAHINISRNLLDSRTPGYDQLGTVWLPLLHVISLPFVRSIWLWSTGLAGTIPVSICLIAAGICFYFAAKEAYGCSLAAGIVLAALV